jgi:hypothetical protein
VAAHAPGCAGGRCSPGCTGRPQAPAILVPGAALADPEYAGNEPRIAGIPANQLTMQAAVLWPVLAAGYALPDDRRVA